MYSLFHELSVHLFCMYVILFITLFLAVLGLHLLCGPSLVADIRGMSLLAVHVFSLWWLLLLRSLGSRACRLQ